MEELGEPTGEEGQGTKWLLFGQVSILSSTGLHPIDIRIKWLHFLGVHVNGDHPHLLPRVHGLLDDKEVSYVWPVDVHLRKHENVAWEVLKRVGRLELIGGDGVVLFPHLVL